MRKLFILLLLSITFSTHTSHGQNSKLAPLNYMLGDWQGDGWMLKGNEKINFTSQERIRLMAEGACIALEGLGKRMNDAVVGEIVHSAFAVITYDKIAEQYKLKGYKLNIETPFTNISERVWEWRITNDKGYTSKFIFDFSVQDHWIERGEYSTDGKEWNTFMEIKFKKEYKTETTSAKANLIQAVLARDISAIKIAIHSGSSLYSKDETGYTAIDYAVERHVPDAMRLILIAMTDEFVLQDEEKKLRDAIVAKDSAAVLAILSNGASGTKIEFRGELGSLLLSLAAIDGNEIIGKALIEYHRIEKQKTQVPNCITINSFNNSGYTALPLAVRFGHHEFAKLLIQAGADVNLQTKSKYQTTPLMEASRNGEAAIALLLLKNGAQVNKRDVYGDHALNWGAYFGGLEFVKVLLAYGADCNIVGQSAIEVAKDIAKREGHSQVFESLIEHCK